MAQPRTPSLRRGHYPELDAYRGLAAPLIVIFHCYTTSGANRGGGVYLGTPAHTLLYSLDGVVAAFFVLSGFLLFLPFARAVADGTAGPQPRAFLLRRAIGIFPLYFLLTFLLWPLTTAGTPDAGRNLLAHLTFTQIFAPIPATWSLSLEVIYYLGLALLGPALARGGARLSAPGRARLLVATPLLLIGVSVAYKAWAAGIAGIMHQTTITCGPVARGDAFAVGMLLASVAVLRAGRPVVGTLGGWVPPPLGGGVFVLAMLARPRGGWADAYFHTACAVRFALLLASTVPAPPGTGRERALSWQPVQ